MGFKKWVVSSYDKSLAKTLSEECNVDPIVALIASSRGYTDPTELEQFILDEPYFSDPYAMADIEIAAELVNEAVANKEKIAVYGDYDCDGVTATALFYSYLKAMDADCIYYIPDRFSEGYGMNCQAVEKLAGEGIKLIITVDNGIVAFEEIKLAHKLGMKVVVTDHHLPADALPEAEAVVDPHRADCPSDFKEVCGAEVAFRLICVMAKKEPEELLPYFADLLSLAVIADIMPLTLENRSIVKCGIEKIKESPLTGIAAVLSVAGIEREKVTSSKIAFGICPRINAAGRIGDAARAVELLVTDNMMTALSIANEIDADNASRQQIEKSIYAEAVRIIEEEKLAFDRVIVVSGKGWHHGVVGIVASRICERYGCPTVLISEDGELASGSGRSIEGFSLYDAINTCRDMLIKFGGHDGAAGVTLKTEDIPEFRKRINEYAFSREYIPPVLKLDLKLNPPALSLDLAFALEELEPFGEGNRTPLFGVYGATLERITPIGGGKHLRLLFRKGENSFQGLLFGVTAESICFEIGDVLDLAVTVEPNCFNGEYSVSVQIKAIRISETNDDLLFAELSDFNDFSAGRIAYSERIFPSREEVGALYREICQHPISLDRIKYKFINTLGIGKTLTAVKVLEELGLIRPDSKNRYFKAEGAEKTSLLNSKTYKILCEGSGKYNE